ncbi:MAG TPA: hypothetical protein VI603_13360 [Saprospiraceae bacterium]|nr:hypothetical protein [Saprospiraceae bacterium]
MESETKKYWLNEISRLTWMITLPQTISAPLSVILIELFTPSFVVLDILHILDFFVISFPLTLAVAIITNMVRSDQSNAVLFIVIIVGAGLLSNLLHKFISSSFPPVSIEPIFREATEPDPIYRSRGIGPLLNTAIGIIGIYWRQFGPMMFIQACGIRVYVGIRYFKLVK